LLIMFGLVLAGPWLTMLGARALARRTSRPATLIAGRRLADDPKAGFRAISGLVLALFVGTTAIATITTIAAYDQGSAGESSAGTTLSGRRPMSRRRLWPRCRCRASSSARPILVRSSKRERSSNVTFRNGSRR